MKNVKLNYLAFTLAEILLTLTIIGVIASLTVPALVQNIQDQQFKIAWKNAYGFLDQATRRILLDNAGSIKGICSSDDCLKDLYLEYLSYTKSCLKGKVFGNCWHNGDNNFWYLNGDPLDWENETGAILNNGTLLFIYNISKNCTGDCGMVCADINGFKKPNVIDKDIFCVHVQKNGIKPYGTQGDSYDPYWTCVNNDSGYGCSAKYLYQ